VGYRGRSRLRVLRPELAVSSRLGDLQDLQGPRLVGASAARYAPNMLSRSQAGVHGAKVPSSAEAPISPLFVPFIGFEVTARRAAVGCNRHPIPAEPL
jgi:hypothetical protein